MVRPHGIFASQISHFQGIVRALEDCTESDEGVAAELMAKLLL